MQKCNFMIPFPVKKVSENQQITYNSELISLGSCFADNLSEKLSFYKFSVFANPFGVIFQPLAIENILGRAFSKRFFTEEDVLFYNELWLCLEVHSKCSSPDKKEMLSVVNQKLIELHKRLKKATHLVITLGTAWVYEYLPTKKIVANCHKIPQKEFQKKILSAEDILESLCRISNLIEKNNPRLNVIFTISPVRHLKDGLVENQRSKSLLISVLHQFLEEKKEQYAYFPSYEILMDELRDYRFYTDDLIHPSNMAINYIWQRFSEVYITPTEYGLMKEIEQIQQGLLHKPQHPEVESYQLFERKLNERIKNIQKNYPKIQF